MVPANKILTVAYGTFSCTLEGFDDPFSTMTGIAEYFRDLAADDRFFGAEPPTPDMAMLRTIAESRARHAVVARTEDGGVTLRPRSATAATVVDPDAEQAASEAQEIDADDCPSDIAVDVPSTDQSQEMSVEDVSIGSGEDTTFQERQSDHAQRDEAPEQDDALAIGGAQKDDSLAAKLARIRTMIEADRKAIRSEVKDDAADTSVPAAGGDASLHSAEATSASHVRDDEGNPASDPEMWSEDDMAAAFAADGLTDDAVPEIDGVVADEISVEAGDDNLPEENLEAREDQLSEGPGTEPAQDTARSSFEDQASDESPHRIGIRRVRRIDYYADTIEASPVEDVAASHPETPSDGVPSSNLAASEVSGSLNQGGSDEPIHDDDLMAELAALRAENGTGEGSDGLEDAREKTGSAADEIDFSEEPRPDDAENPVVTGEGEASSLTPAVDIADDRRDLVRSGETKLHKGGESARTSHDAPLTADMERLFAATDSRLSDEDASQRQANISHVKAAVAARRAEGPPSPAADSQTAAYRADLADTVRPRRRGLPAEAEKRTGRPERPSTLMLVSEQRVETGVTGVSTPVQPRRAMRSAEIQADKTAAAGADRFESFASRVGATKVTDVLEAAAVYSVKLKGQENFSRPRLLHLAAEALDDMSREDGLRAFGQLLRDGTIRKVSRGTFALAGDSRYAQDSDRRAG